jgi:hypothetical protein
MIRMPKTKHSRSVKMLFIGNSFTKRNNLPGLLAELAAPRGVRVTHELISAGGASLRTHWNAGHATKAIEAGGYDYVVLQEQSTLPVKNAGRMAENVWLFNEVIKRSASKTVLYMTWAREHLPEHQKVIAEAYNSIAHNNNALVVPAGIVWQHFRATYDRPNLYSSDGSHPSPAGSYLVACVFVASLFGASPSGLKLKPNGLEQSEALTIQSFVGHQFRIE